MSYSGPIIVGFDGAIQQEVIGQLSVEELFEEQAVHNARDEMQADAANLMQ